MAYRAFVVNKDGDDFTASVQTLDESTLPEGDVTVAVEWSDLNYKDGLACTPNGRVVTSYPMTLGIDFAGTVVESSDSRYAPGDAVVATGYDLGTGHPGGYAERVRVPADWLSPRPEGMSSEEAMTLGTAGITAAMSIDAIEKAGIRPEAGPVIVSGATGGVGSTAVAMLAARGYTVHASTGKATEHDFLRELGASEILDRDELSAESRRPLESERWAAGIDPVGGPTTATMLRQTRYGGAVAVSGLAGGVAIGTTVMPFILRGVSLVGIESVYWPGEDRPRLWARMADDFSGGNLLDLVEARIGLEDVPEAGTRILAGGVRGRVLVQPS
ncbi:MAG: oxidoreductase [Chloroflexi bacterium]|nr:oxidoreductase [Chloroflexota bacterium]MYD17534.1 oxidoreductase [Chloroflexota bacterium]MYJ01819.1 oxidoreductase [Chloroflexota bacterium]